MFLSQYGVEARMCQPFSSGITGVGMKSTQVFFFIWQFVNIETIYDVLFRFIYDLDFGIVNIIIKLSKFHNIIYHYSKKNIVIYVLHFQGIKDIV